MAQGGNVRSGPGADKKVVKGWWDRRIFDEFRKLVMSGALDEINASLSTAPGP